MSPNSKKRFNDFIEESRFLTKGVKGPLAVGLTVTRYAVKNGLPIDPASLLTEKGGQVATLGKSQVQSILSDYGIAQVLAEEGGRTSRGSIGNMQEYVAFLNELNPNQDELKDLESLWVDKVKAFFASKPLKLHFDPSKSMNTIIKDILSQAEHRQKQIQGSTIVGAILQHLIGAKLDILTNGGVKHHGANVADEQSGRAGDFLIDDVSIHVTTFPSEAVMRKCANNLGAGLRPILLTIGKGMQIAEWQAEQFGIEDRIDIFDAEQFLAGNFYELGSFAKSKREVTARAIFEKYNSLIEQYETDQSLKIE
ncbi:MAG: DUF4928 family protein [Synergistaceae bacterium]|jgi:hypothetical protein|nr:DUF4928 family protein [Synergistaceae bacterium]